MGSEGTEAVGGGGAGLAVGGEAAKTVDSGFGAGLARPRVVPPRGGPAVAGDAAPDRSAPDRAATGGGGMEADAGAGGGSGDRDELGTGVTLCRWIGSVGGGERRAPWHLLEWCGVLERVLEGGVRAVCAVPVRCLGELCCMGG